MDDMESVILNYSDICRVCLSQGEDLVSIFDKDDANDEFSINEILMACTSVQVEQGDGYPGNICRVCYNELDAAYKLRRTCQQSDDFLRSCNDIPTIVHNVQIDEDSKSSINGINDYCFLQVESPNSESASAECVTNIDSQCNEHLTDETELIEEVEKHHTNDEPKAKYSCQVCDEKFIVKRNLRHHILLHTEGEKSESGKYLCELCNQEFSFRCNLRRHMLTHTGEKPHRCSFCNKGFTQSSNLENHIRVHTGEQPFVCEICKKSFKRKAALKVHTLKHTGEKPFSCAVCGRSFTQIGHLNYHARVHSGEKPYTCEICGKQFALNSNLRVHVRIHTGETPFTCDICNKGYNDSNGLKKHKKIHEKLFQD